MSGLRIKLFTDSSGTHITPPVLKTKRADMAFKKARDGLLSHRHVTVDQQKIFDQNLSESRLLNLPPELRQRIYQYVVGGHHFYISKPCDPGFKYQICKDGCPEESALKTCSNVNHEGGFSWSRITPSEFENSDTKLTLLTMVCRQLHQETSLLVYQTNMFSFTAVRTMSVWLKSLKPVQQRSINVVCLPTWYPFYKMHKKQLSGVKRVYHWSKKEKLVKCLTPQEFQGMERYPEESDSELDWY